MNVLRKDSVATSDSKPDELLSKTLEATRKKTEKRMQLDPFNLLDEEEEGGLKRDETLANLDSFLRIEDRFREDDDLPKRSEDKLKDEQMRRQESLRQNKISPQ